MLLYIYPKRGYIGEINAKGIPGLIRLYISARNVFEDTAKKKGIPFALLELAAKKIEFEIKEVTS